jgi:hypothetical protein
MKNLTRTTWLVSILVWAVTGPKAIADDCCVPHQAYRVVYRTVYDEKQVTAYRLEYETRYQEKTVTSYKPQMFNETREEVYLVQKPIYETAYRTEYTTKMVPYTTYRTETVDQGCYVDQQICVPGRTSYRLAYQPPVCLVDPTTGVSTSQGGGWAWVAAQAPSRVKVQRVWKPNVVQRQVAVTCHKQEVTAHRVPYKTCKYVTERHVRQVSVQVCKMVAVEQTVRVPYCVEKRIPVTYTCRTPRTVACYQPIDACGVPCGPCSLPTAATAPAVPTPAPVEPGTGKWKSIDESANSPTPADADAPKIDPAVKIPPTPEETKQNLKKPPVKKAGDPKADNVKASDIGPAPLGFGD